MHTSLDTMICLKLRRAAQCPKTRFTGGLTLSILFSLVFCAQVVQAEDAAPIQVGDSSLYPLLRFDYRQTDNAARTNTDQIESASTVFAPSLRWVADRGLTSLEAFYSGEYAVAEEERTDYQDHETGFSIETSFSKRSRLRANLGLKLGHEEFGTGLSRVDSLALQESNEFRRMDFSLVHTYGAAQARGRLLTGLNIFDQDFTNNESRTRASNRFVVEPYLIFSIRHAGDTRWFLDLRYAAQDYEVDEIDGARIRSYVGVAWETSGKTGGEAKIGGVTRTYDNDFPTQSTAGVDIQFYYNTSSFSRFDFRAIREFEGLVDSQTALDGKEAISTQLSVNWNYDWSSRLSHRITLGQTRFDRECPDANDSTRTDASAELTLQIRRWLSVGANLRFDGRASESCNGAVTETLDRDYDRQRIGIHTIVSL